MNLRAALVVTMTLLIVAMGSIIAFLKSQNDRLAMEHSQAIEMAKTDKSVISYYKNNLDRETAKVVVLDLSLRNTKELMANDRLNFVKQFSGINNRLNNIDQLSQTTAQVVKSWQLPLRDTFLLNLDSSLISAKTFSYRDSLNQISGTIIGNQINPTIDITVPLQGVVYWQRNKILGLRIGKKKWFSDITSTNPFAKVKMHEIIRVNKK